MSPEFFIRRPVLTTLVMAAILLFGVMGFRLLPVSDLPNVDVPTIQVAAALPGARLETIPRAGHLSTLDNPAAVNAALAAFLDAQP